MTTSPPSAATAARVLLVEDDEADAFLVRELLADTEADVKISWARSLAEAREQASDAFDCVLLDLGLPDASGFDALRGVLESAPDVAVLVLTGLDDERTGIEALASGAQDYLVKGQVDGPLLGRSIRYARERKRLDLELRRLYRSEAIAAENARLERGLVPRPRDQRPGDPRRAEVPAGTRCRARRRLLRRDADQRRVALRTDR